MTRRSRIWLIVAAVFTIINVAGIPLAAAAHEWLHTGTHVVLALLGAFAVWGLSPQRRLATADALGSSAIGAQLTSIEQAVDAVAIEVERIGESQRFMTRLFGERTGQPTGRETAPPAETPTPADPPRDA